MGDLRLSGLASGMDTDAMVQSMMRVERMKVDRYEQDKQISMWRQEAYNNTNKSFANFILNTRKDMGLSKTGSTGVITSSSYKNFDYVREVSSSDETKVSVSSTNKAVNGSYSVDVQKLATGASFASVKLTDENGKLKSDIEAKLKDKMEFTINGAKITVNKSGDSVEMGDVVKAINSATKTEGTKQVPLGVSAFYDKTNGRLFMQTDKTGAGAKIELDAVVGSTGKAFIDSLQSGGSVNKDGVNAKIIFNDVELEYDSNNINLNGINMELKSEGIVNVKVDTNVDGMMEKIQKFVEDYNKLIDDTAKLLGEKTYSSFRPLSQEEKKAMTEDDVKLWTEKAQSGMLNRDETIGRTLQNMRTQIYKHVEGVEGPFTHITQIGITTEEYARGTAGGKLKINEEKLREKLLENPEAVMELLFKEGEFDDNGKEIVAGDPNNPNKPYTSMGVFSGIYNKLKDGMKAIIDKSGKGENETLYRGVNSVLKQNILLDFVTKKSSISDIDKAIMDMDKRIDNLNVLLNKKEDAYYAKFTQMEKYLQKMNSQSGWLSQQFM